MSPVGRVAVTGAFGFVGRALCRLLVERGFDVTALVRRVETGPSLPGVHLVEIGDIRSADWSGAIANAAYVVHLAARVHVMRERGTDTLRAYREVNVEPTRTLARIVADLGVRRFVYMSSIKVNGERTSSDCYRAEDPPAPVDAYAISKLEAERAVAAAFGTGASTYTIIRPPLVYGPGVGANFLRLMQAIDRGIPLPFASVQNRRSLIYRANLADLVIRCLDHPNAANETFLASDGEDLSTPELIRRISYALGRPPRVIRVPPRALRTVGTVFGRQALMQRLCDSLVIDSSHLRKALDWHPPYTTTQGLAATAEWFRRGQQDRL